MHELYQVCWRPQGQVEQPLGDPFHPLPTPHASALDYLAKKKVPSKPVGAYRPPGARGQTTSLAFKREDEGGAAFSREGGSSSFGAASINGFGKPRRREVPGAEPVEFVPPGAAPGGGVALPPGAESTAADEKLSKSAAKNKKKREAKKAKETADKEAGELAPPTGPQQGQRLQPSPDRRENRSKSRNRNRAESNVNGSTGGANKPGKPAAAPAPAAPASPAATESNSSQDKRIRGLLKKLRAIDELKMRLASGEKLEDTQMKKIQTEDSVRKELEGLDYTV